MIRIATADMHRAGNVRRHLVETPLDPFKPEFHRILDLPREQRLIELDELAPGINQRQNFPVDRRRQIARQTRPVVIMAIGGGVHDRQWPRQGEFDRLAAD